MAVGAGTLDTGVPKIRLEVDESAAIGPNTIEMVKPAQILEVVNEEVDIAQCQALGGSR